MAISDSDHLDFMRKVSEDLGEIKSAQKSTLSYLEAVSKNVKDVRADHDSHKQDTYAHGIGFRIKVVSWVLGIPSAIAGLWFSLKSLVGIGHHG